MVTMPRRSCSRARRWTSLPDDPHLQQLWLDVSIPAVVTTEPAGADVAFAPYRTPTTWFPLGRTPLNGVRIPRTLIRVRISKPGFQTIEGSGSPPGQRYRLDPVDAVPPGHGARGRRPRSRPVRRRSASSTISGSIDSRSPTGSSRRSSISGGYRRRDYWREPFVEGGRSVPWEEAIARFRDATGRPGPATWKSGTYPDGQADFPVGGVSWYEAAAYAAFAGKSLPTIYHWYRAADLGRFADILTVSNFGGTGPAPVGSYDGLGPFGTYDMAGNVKEWCSNEVGRPPIPSGRRVERAEVHVRGLRRAGGRSSGRRSYGFRLAKYIRPLPTAAVTAPVPIEALVP